MSNRELPMMPWYPDQFAAATSTWSFAERSAYRALLDVQWALGVLPDDPARLARAIAMDEPQFELVWPIIRTKFDAVEGGLRNFRLEEHRLSALKRKERQRSAARETNAMRSANRGAERITKRDAERALSETVSGTASETVSGTHPSPSPSPDKNSGSGSGTRARAVNHDPVDNSARRARASDGLKKPSDPEAIEKRRREATEIAARLSAAKGIP